MTENNYEKDEEIDLSELFTTLWCHKLWIALVTSFFIFFSGYYVLNTDKQFTAVAVFEIEQNHSNNLNIPSEFGALASLAGLSGVASSNLEVLLERILERNLFLK